eukprot:2300159-Prymnesium_polylepis.1
MEGAERQHGNVRGGGQDAGVQCAEDAVRAVRPQAMLFAQVCGADQAAEWVQQELESEGRAKWQVHRMPEGPARDGGRVAQAQARSGDGGGGEGGEILDHRRRGRGARVAASAS